MERKKTKAVNVADIPIGGGNPVVIQSMLSRPSTDIQANVEQAKRLKAAGCEVVRAAIPDMDAVRLVDAVKSATGLPFVADIHFDYRLAIESVAAGADKIRINPGNIGDAGRVRQVVDACRAKGTPIRVGVNAGSLEKEILQKYGKPTPQALVDSALYHVSLIEQCGYDNIVVSIKSSDVSNMIAACRLFSGQSRYPLHLGVTEAGTPRMGLVKSAVGIGALLCDGIGDTIRVSLTAEPEQEISAAMDILRACGLRRSGVNLVSCPTCGRTRVGLIQLAQQVEKAVAGISKPLTVAVMGCVVNGPGEAREADAGVACGEGCGVLFKKGEIVKKVPESEIVQALLALIDEM